MEEQRHRPQLWLLLAIVIWELRPFGARADARDLLGRTDEERDLRIPGFPGQPALFRLLGH